MTPSINFSSKMVFDRSAVNRYLIYFPLAHSAGHYSCIGQKTDYSLFERRGGGNVLHFFPNSNMNTWKLFLNVWLNIQGFDSIQSLKYTHHMISQQSQCCDIHDILAVWYPPSPIHNSVLGSAKISHCNCLRVQYFWLMLLLLNSLNRMTNGRDSTELVHCT